MQLERVNCLLCRADDPRSLFEAQDINLLRPGTFGVVQCRRCGLVYTNPRPTRDAMSAFYPDEYWAGPPLGDAQPYLDRATRIALEQLGQAQPGQTVLDVGCGVGTVLRVLSRQGWGVCGVDVSQHACELAREFAGTDVFCGTLEDANFAEENFDAVTLFDVAEHLPDPVATLRHIRRLLRPGGRVFIKVPNMAALQARLLRRWWYWLDVPRHLVHFSPRTLARALQAAGFEDLQCRAIPTWAGGQVLETSVLYWLRSVRLRRKGIEVLPAEGQPVGESLEGHVYPGVPSLAKRAFRWGLRNVLYAPLAVENLLGRSAVLLAVAKR